MTTTTRYYYRIQPKGLDVTGHRSEDSAGAREDLHVYSSAWQTLDPDGQTYEVYGDEIVVVAAGESTDNGDAEGVAVDADEAEVVARFPLEDWLTRWEEFLGLTETRSLPYARATDLRRAGADEATEDFEAELLAALGL